MKKSEKQDLLNEIERLHKRIEQEEKLNFSRTAQITKLQTELDTREKACRELCVRLDEKEKQIEELESELRVKEDLFKIKSGLKSEELPDSITIDGYKCTIIQTEQGLYISRDDIYKIVEQGREDLRSQVKVLEDRYQSDCIRTNQLQVTIDVLVERIARLREVMGL